ncbi:MAG: TonB-dependent receptor plug domain-containing protein [Candidatus Omnitrophica bacterium]|nr:TonB-dependent receptor plug domain-containing protein [Candidatus Omnitrophota bacterium]
MTEPVSGPVPGQEVIVQSFGSEVTTPARTSERIYNINRNVTLITREEIERLQPRDVQDILDKVPGVTVNRLFDNPKDNQVDIRGFGETGPMNTLVLIDGRRINQVDLSGADLSQIDVDCVERVEIIRGAGTVLYGDNATGGVINIVTRRGAPGQHHLLYTQEFGSYRYHKESFQARGGEKVLDYFLNMSFQDTDGFRLNGGYEAVDVFTGVTLRPSDNFRLDFSSGYHKDWYGMPGALYDINLQSDGMKGSRFPDSKAKTEEYYFETTPVLTTSTGSHEIMLSGFFSYRHRRSNSRSVGFNVYESDHHIGTWDVRPKAEIRSYMFEGKAVNTLVAGVDMFSSTDRIRSGDIRFTNSQVEITKRSVGIYASDSVVIDDSFILNGGVRGQWAEYGFDQSRPIHEYDTRSLREMAVEAGIGYKYNARSQVYANYSRSYRMPATDEFFQSAYEALDYSTWPLPPTVRVFPAVINTDLEHQLACNFEIGVKDNTYGPLNLDLAYYFIDTKDEIYYDPVNFMNENYPRTFRHGLELNAALRVHEYVRAYLNYAHQRAFFAGGKFASNDIPLVPNNKVTLGAALGPIYGFSADMLMNYVGSRYPVSDQFNSSARLKAYTTVDMIFKYSVECLEAFIRVDNIFDKEYFSSGTRNFAGNTAFYPGPERSVRAGVSLRF